MKTVIMAGGRGTRISSIAHDIPKPMLRIGGKPVLEREIECLRSQGFKSLIITVSHFAEQIINYFGDGTNFGVEIEYFVEKSPLGNAGALFKMRDILTEDFLLVNADALFDVDLNRFYDYHKSKGGLATIITHPNSHPYDSGLIIADNNGEVKQWITKEDNRPQWYANRVNAGIHIINPTVLDMTGIVGSSIGLKSLEGNIIKVDLDRQILKPLCGTGKMYCYDSPEYIKDMGTPDRFRIVSEDFRTGRIHARNLKNKQRAVFIDRDGTINKYVGFLKNIDDFELLPGVAKAIRLINESGYLAIVITNQPVIARGEVTFEQLQDIHNKMETLLGAEGAYLDAVYFCPHHPSKGYEGEVVALKIECECRKPKPGMIIAASKEYNIDLAQSWMIGDSEIDILTGSAAGCRTALIGEGTYNQDITVNSLLEFVDGLSNICGDN